MCLVLFPPPLKSSWNYTTFHSSFPVSSFEKLERRHLHLSTIKCDFSLTYSSLSDISNRWKYCSCVLHQFKHFSLKSCLKYSWNFIIHNRNIPLWRSSIKDKHNNNKEETVKIIYECSHQVDLFKALAWNFLETLCSPTELK